MRFRNDSRRGTALVITVGLLAVLAVIGFGFAVLSRLHQEQSVYYKAAAQLDLLAQAAIQYAIGQTRASWTNAQPANPTFSLTDALDSYPSGAMNDATDNPSCPWFWYIDGNSNTDKTKQENVPWIPTGCYLDDSNGTDTTKYYARYCNLKCSSYALVHNVLGDVAAVTNVRVIDSASKININDNYDDDDSVLRKVLDTLLKELGIPIADLTGTQLIDYRNADRPKGCGKQFASMGELKLAIRDKATDKSDSFVERTYDTLKNYLTIYSWPWDPPSLSDFTPGTLKPDHTTGDATLQKLGTLQAQASKHRSPVNINTAPRPVLVALIASVKTQEGAVNFSTDAGLTTARLVADWIIRRRDPENIVPWRSATDHTVSAEWKTCLGKSYASNVRKRAINAWRSYPVGPLSSWHGFMDLVYSLTDDVGSDPFPLVLQPEEAEALIAAFCPNPFPSLVPRDTWHLAYARLMQKDAATVEQKLRQFVTLGTSTQAKVLGRNDLAEAKGPAVEFCFSSKGRFEISARTYAFQKADFGKVGSYTDYTLLDGSDPVKSWSTSPPQWRGFNVLIYDGKGKGQLRAIVQNTSNTLTVAKWGRSLWNNDDSPPPGTPAGQEKWWQSRYYILGPGPLLDRSTWPDTAIAFESDYAVLSEQTDPGWEPNQWAGQRIVIYKATITKGGGPNGEDTETILPDQSCIQERLILTNTTNKLTLSPALDQSLLAGGTVVRYIILGCFGAAEHEAAVKAYDVLHHTSQLDFLNFDPAKDPNTKSLNTLPPGNADPPDVVVGPNPCDLLTVGVDDKNRTLDGWIALKKNPISNASCFVQTFKTTDLKPDGGVGGDLKSSIPSDVSLLAKDVFAGGSLLTDGLYLRNGSSAHLGYSVTDLVSEKNTDGGFVSFWFRPDKDFFSTTDQRTLICIKGASKDADEEGLRLVYDGSDKKIKLIIRMLKERKYEHSDTIVKDKLHTDNGILKVNYWSGPGKEQTYIDAKVSDVSKWKKPGQWHHIAFAWYECCNDTITQAVPPETADPDWKDSWDSDAVPKPPPDPPTPKPETDWRDDHTGDLGTLDDEVYSRVRLWIDGDGSGPSPGDTEKTPKPFKAFNLCPASDGSMLQIGDGTASLAGTIDGIVAVKHGDKNLLDKTFTDLKVLPPLPADNPRYKVVDTATSSYKSRGITLANKSGSFALGTVAWTGLLPYTDTKTYNWDSTKKYPIRVEVSLSNGTTTITSDPVPDAARVDWQSFIGEGAPLRRTSSGNPVIVQDANTIKYNVYLLSGVYGDPDPAKEEWVFPGWQTPVLEDITITYLGPVIYYYWR